MKRIQPSNQSIIRTLLIRLWIDQCAVPQFLEGCCMVIESFSLIILLTFDWSTITLPFNQAQIPVPILMALITLALLIQIILRLLKSLILIRPIYIILILINQSSIGMSSAANIVFSLIFYALLGCILCADATSKTQLQFISDNPHAETLNSTKFVHYLVFVFVLLINIHGTASLMAFISPSLSFIALIVLFVLKSQSMYRNQMFKQLSLRLYLFVMFYALKSLVVRLAPKSSTFALIHQHIVVVALSQTVYQILRACVWNKVQLSSYGTDGQGLLITYKILSQCYALEPDERYSQILKQINEQQDQLNTDSHNPAMTRISKRLSTFMEDSYKNKQGSCSFDGYFYLLKAQIEFHINRKLISSKQLLEQAKQVNCSQTPWYNRPLEKICLMKFESTIRHSIIKHNNTCDFNQFFDNQKLRIAFVQSAQDYAKLWAYLNASPLRKTRAIGMQQIQYHNIFRGNVSLCRLNDLLSNLLTKRKQLYTSYRNTPIKCTGILREYIEYLYLIERDVERANQELYSLKTFPQIWHCLFSDDKVYISIELNGLRNSTRIAGIGANVTRLLGYERSELLKENYSVLLPDFYRKLHEEISEQQIYRMTGSELSHFYKNIIMKHKKGYYLPAELNLKVVYDLSGDFFLEGYFQISDRCKNPCRHSQYNWADYIFIDQANSRLLEIGEELCQIIPMESTSYVLYHEYFEDYSNLSDKILKMLDCAERRHDESSERYINSKYLLNDDKISRFDLLLEMTTQTSNKIQFYVSKNDRSPSQLQELPSNSILSEENEEDELESQQMIQNEGTSLKQGMLTDQIQRMDFYKKLSIKMENISNPLLLYQYFLKQQELQKLLGLTKQPSIWLTVFLLVFGLLAISISGALVYLLNVEAAQNEEFLEDFIYVQRHYKALTEISLIGNRLVLFYHFGYEAPDSVIQRYNELSLQVQNTNTYLSKYSKKEYQLENYEGFPDLEQIHLQHIPKKGSQFINEYISSIYINIFSVDSAMLQFQFANTHILFRVLLNGLVFEYIDNFEESIATDTAQQFILKHLMIGLMCFFVIAVTAIMLKAIKQVINLQAETLCTFAGIQGVPTFMNGVKEYLQKITGDTSKVTESQQAPQSHAKNNISKGIGSVFGNDINTPNSFSSRENSVRSLIEQNMNQTMSAQKTQPQGTQHLSVSENLSVEKQIFKQIPNRLFVPILVCSLILFGSPIVYKMYIQLNSSSIVLEQSILKLSNIYWNQIHFTYTMLAYFDAVMHEEYDSSAFRNNLEAYRAQDKQLESTFEQVNIPDFAEFAEKLTELRYQYLCLYSPCGPLYYDQLNIVYTNTIHKLYDYMENNLNIKEIQYQTLNSRALLHGSQITFDVIYTLLATYSDSFKFYQHSLQQTAQIFYQLNCWMISLGFVAALLVYTIWITRIKSNLSGILNISKKNSYDHQELNQIAIEAQNETDKPVDQQRWLTKIVL